MYYCNRWFKDVCDCAPPPCKKPPKPPVKQKPQCQLEIKCKPCHPPEIRLEIKI